MARGRDLRSKASRGIDPSRTLPHRIRLSCHKYLKAMETKRRTDAGTPGPDGPYEMVLRLDGHRLTLSECFPPGPRLIALCLTGRNESPEVYLSPVQAYAMGLTLLRFARPTES